MAPLHVNHHHQHKEKFMPSPRTSDNGSKTKARSVKAPTKAPNAVQLLKDDHRQVEEWFATFEKARSEPKKLKLARQICAALTVHMTIEEEIFYPAFLAAAADKDLHDEAYVEHAGAKRLIAEIEGGQPGDDKWEAKVTVLGEMIKHHVKEEEQRDGMFAQAKQADLDLEALGAAMAARKRELLRQG